MRDLIDAWRAIRSDVEDLNMVIEAEEGLDDETRATQVKAAENVAAEIDFAVMLLRTE